MKKWVRLVEVMFQKINEDKWIINGAADVDDMFENLELDRPLAVFDIESTGIVPQRDRIVEIAVLKITPDGQTRNTVRRLNPQMPIPPGATAIHGITDADVADCPVFADIAENP